MPCASLPVSGQVSSPYGWRWLNGRSDLHTGVDIGAPEGTPVFALLPGQVVVAAPTGTLSGYGNVIVLQHGDGFFSLYAHLSAVRVLEGQTVPSGALLGAVGRTAGTRDDPTKLFEQSGAHLHLELLSKWPPSGRDLDRLDPGQVLPALGIIVPTHGPLLQTADCSSSSASIVSAARSGLPPVASFGVQARSSARAGAGGFLALAALFLYLKSKRRAVERAA